jgi:AcrR family transcriptional regulator
MQASAATQLSPRAREIVAAARDLLEAEGVEGLSMRRLADRLGIRAPSIYKHLPDKEALEAALISDGLAEWAQLCERRFVPATIRWSLSPTRSGPSRATTRISIG